MTDDRAEQPPRAADGVPARDAREGAEGAEGEPQPTPATPTPAPPPATSTLAPPTPRVSPPTSREPLPAARAGAHLPAGRGRGRVLLPVTLGVVGLLVLAGLFGLGTRLPGILSAAATTASPSPTPTLTPTPTPTPTSTAGPQLAGTYDWSDLRGGECINPWVSAWQQKFTVVDCQTPHGAQVMSRGTLSADPTAAYPGEDAIEQQLNVLCQIPANFNSAILGAYPDVVWQANYPVNAAQWAAGMRDYYCFVSRSSSLPITGNFAPLAFGG